MMRSRQANRDGQHGSDSSEEDSDERSPPRGRSGKAENSSSSKEADNNLDTPMNESLEVPA